MKRFILSLLLTFSIIASVEANNNGGIAFDDGTVWNCDQYFTPIPVRYGYMYRFADIFNNHDSRTAYMNTFSVRYLNGNYLSQGTQFDWTDAVVNAGYQVGPNSSTRVITTTNDDWSIVKHPTTRTNGGYDFKIAYKIGYDFSGNYPDASDDLSHVECQPYYVTWCGDGTVDSQYESCDDGAQNGQPGKCNTSCNGMTPQTPVNGVCGSSNGQTMATTPTNLCNIGVPSTVAGYGPWSWSCAGTNGGSTAYCSANIQPTASCEPSKTGVQSSPLTQGACAVGSVSSFSSSQNGNTTNYSWSCNNAGANASCNASYTVVPQAFDLALKKYILRGGVEYDSQWGNPVNVIQGETDSKYIIRVRNLGIGIVSGTTTVTDDIPAGIDTNGPVVATGWNCAYSGKRLTCTTNLPVPANTYFNDIIVPVKVGITTGYVVNTGSVYNPNENPGNPNRANDNEDPAKFFVGAVPVCTPSKTGVQTQPLTQGYCDYGNAVNFASQTINGMINYTWTCTDGHNTYCSATYTPNAPKFDLSVKKYIQKGGDQDAQTAPGVQSATNDTFTYRIIARNEGPETVVGETIVTDTLPAGVTLNGVITSNGWTCTVGGASITCKVTLAVKSGTSFPDIVVPVRVIATTGSVTNIAEVSNSNEDPTKNLTNDPKNKDPAVFTVDSGTPKLVIKKYAKSKLTGDSQEAGSAVSVKPGETFSYYYVVTNNGTSVAYGSIIKDTLPQYLTIDGAITAPADYNGCTVTATTPNASFYCASAAEIQPGATVELSIPVKVAANIPVNTPIQNIAYVCQKYKAPGVRDDAGCTIDPPPPPPTTGCDTVMSNGEKDPACIIVTGEGFDLAIKKYVGTNDAQPDSPVTVSSGQLINYVIRVQNRGTGSTSGTTTVKDLLPFGVSLSGTISGNGWTCNSIPPLPTNSPTPSAETITCTSSAVIAKDAFFPDITVPVKVTGRAGTVTNYATVHNPNESFPCKNDGSMPSGSETTCEKDLGNIDPAVITLGSTGFDLSIKKYAKSEDVFAVIENNEDFNYTVVVQNNGTGVTSGVTTVKDVLPNFITLRAQPSGNGWDCSSSSGVGGKEVTCTTSAAVDANQVFNVITIPVRATNASFQTNGIVNRAFVHNPNEVAGKRCSSDNSMPAGSESQCAEDKNNSDPATVNPPNPIGFDLRLKKYVNGDDEASVPSSNGSVTYTFTVENLGTQPTTGTTTVTDTFPTGVTPTTAAGSGWSCNINNQIVTCTRSDILAKGAFYPTITVAATVSSTVGMYKNVACLSNPSDPNEGAPYNPANGEYKVNNCDPADVVVAPPGSFDLTIKKKVGKSLTDGTLKDRNTADEGDGEQNILVIAQSGTLVYTFAVTNLGPATATGTTTVEDTLPNDITIVGTPAGSGWNCSVTGNGNRSFSCTRSDTLSSGNVFSDIVVNAQASSTILAGEYSNTATVRNPSDTNPTNNTDPANVKVMVGTSCGNVTANVASPMSPGTTVTYTCSALGYTGTNSNLLEYNIKCGASDVGVWSLTGSTRICNAPNANSATQEISCAVRDISNPNVVFSGSDAGSCKITISTSGGTSGGSSYYVPTCVNGVKTCGTKIYTTQAQCTQVEGISCYTELAACQATANTLSCGGPGGGCTGPGCGGGGGGTYCGNGVVEAYNGEECDLGSTYNGSANSVCSSTCKLSLRKTTTNPGENPILDIWMRIPTLTNARLGLSFADKVKKNFTENQVVIGKNGNVFSIADEIIFGIDTRFKIPLIVPEDYKVCIYSDNTASISQVTASAGEYCQTIGSLAPSFMRRTINGSRYVVIGEGDYVQCRTLTNGRCTEYEAVSAPGEYEVPLFQGNKLVSPATSLREAFQGQVGNGNIRLTIANPSLVKNDRPIDLAMPVRVSNAIAGSTTTTTNRVVNPLSVFQTEQLLDTFLSGLKRSTTLSSTTRSTSSNNTSTSVNNTNVTVRASTVGNTSVKSLDELLALKTNGNDTILSLSGGNLTIENCPNNTLVLEGVRTVIVESGNLIIKCNISYSNGVSSWAFVTKGGDIQVLDNVRSIAGVYVAIATGSSGGNLTGGASTQNSLTVEGSLYGKAQNLIASRQYVRGTSTYDLLSSGIILNYSNKALLYPPPLLSSYLSNYTVERVAR